MTEPSSYTRRDVLAGLAGCAGCIVVAACGHASSPDSSSPDSSAAPSSSRADAADAVGPAPTLVALAAVPVGGAVSVTAPDNMPLLVAQPVAGTVVAFSAACPHQGCTVRPAGTTLKCPCHGSQFALADGSVLNGPAQRGLGSVDVRVAAGNVVLGST